MKSRVERILFFLMALALAGCGGKNATSLHVPQYDEFKSVYQGPEIVRHAAKSIAMVQHEWGGGGTGWFVSADGLLVTNSHVLGPENCARQGCYTLLVQNYLLGATAQTHRLYAEPKSTGVELDAAVFQLYWDADKAHKFESPDFLTLQPEMPVGLFGQPLYIVGHPHLSPMKFTLGQAYRQQGQYWFYSTHFSQPGNSGSPYINEKGNAVGIVHRVADKHGRVTPGGVEVYSVGTSSEALRELIGAIGKSATEKSLDELYPDPRQPTTESDAVEHQLAYLSAHQDVALLEKARPDGKKEALLPSLLAEACAEGLSKRNFRTLDQVSRSIEPCEQVVSWMECREKSPARKHLFCPVGRDRSFWQQAFATVAERLHRYNLAGHYNWITFNPSTLEDSVEKGNAVALQGLNGFIGQTRPGLSFELAFYKVNFAGTVGDLAQDGHDLTQFVRGYRKQPFFSRSFNWILSSLGVLYDRQQITPSEYTRALEGILADAHLPLDEKLQLEEMAYWRGLLKP